MLDALRKKTSQRCSLFVLIGLCCEIHWVRRGPGSHYWTRGASEECSKVQECSRRFAPPHRLRERGQGIHKRKPIGFATIPADRLRADSTKTPQSMMLKMLQNAVRNATFGNVSVLLESCGVCLYACFLQCNGRNHPVLKIYYY